MADVPGVLLDQVVHADETANISQHRSCNCKRLGQTPLDQVLEIMRDVHHAMFPQPNTGAYMEWAKTRDARLKKVHGA